MRGSGRRPASGGSGSRTGPSASGVNASWPRMPPKRARASLDGPSASRRTGVPARLIERRTRAVSGTSSGEVSRSLTSRIEPSFTLSPSSMSCASWSAVEMRVPARNVSDHGLTTLPEPVRGEQPDDRPQLPRRRSRRQQLVRHVGEDDEADGRVRVDEGLERASDDPGLVVEDREGEVEDDDARRPGREQASVARVELARTQDRGDEQDDRTAAEEHAQRERAQARRPGTRRRRGCPPPGA